MTTSNTVPIQNSKEGFWTWRFEDIYTGPTGSGQYVPLVNDIVSRVIITTETRYVVTAVDPQTLLSTLQLLLDDTSNNEFPADTLFAAGPGPQSASFQYLVNSTVTPAVACVDKRCWVAGSLSSFAKIFRGVDISSAGVVISAVFDANGNYVSSNVPLEKAGVFQGQALTDNVSIWIPQTHYTNVTLNDGEVVTIVFYDINGFQVSWRQLVVRNTSYILALNAPAKEVISIGLQTPFLAASNSTQINYPMGVPVNAMNLIGIVNYSDGTSQSYGIDGVHFSVSGLDAYAPTVAGQITNIVLRYKLQTNEEAIGVSANGILSQSYSIVTQAANGTYAVQIYVIPVWQGPTTGYVLNYYLRSLDRTVSYNITPYVVIDTTYAAFQPLNYGAKQTLRLYVNMADVNAIYASFNHIQIVDVTLNNPGTSRPVVNGVPNWTIANQSGQLPVFGVGVYAKFYAPGANTYQITLTGDFTDQASWLTAYYYDLHPQYNPLTESGPVLPTHFTIGDGVLYLLSQWNVAFTTTSPIVNNGTLTLRFMSVSPQATLHLAVAPVSLRQIDVNGNYL